jgi:hypothetical protein
MASSTEEKGYSAAWIKPAALPGAAKQVQE